MFAFRKLVSGQLAAPAISRSHPGFIVDRRHKRNERFLQFLAFGFCFTHERAREGLDWFARCKEDWMRSGQESVYLGLSPKDRNAFIADLLESVVKNAIARVDATRPLTMGLSAGFDSRLLHYFMRKNGFCPLTYTFGQIGNFDFDFVKILSQRMGLPTEFFDTSEMEWSWEPFENNAVCAQDLPISPRVMAQHGMNALFPSRLDIHGYLGGALTGALLPREPSPTWQDALVLFRSKNDAFGWQTFLDGDQLLPRQPFVEQDTLSFDAQLNLAYRQWQRIRPVFTREPQDLLFPLEDRRWVGFWLSRSAEDLVEQKRYLQFIRSLAADEFFDLSLYNGVSKAAIRNERINLLYGAECPTGWIDKTTSAKLITKSPTAHFCLFTCYRNNASFRRMVGQSLERLRARRVFAPSFIDETKRRFESGEAKLDKMLNGLVTTDLALERHLFN